MTTTYYFDSLQRQANLEAELVSWQGTPFRPGIAKPGIGVDCIRFVVAVLEGCGVPVESLRPLPDFHLREGRHREHTRIMEWLRNSPESEAHLEHALRDDPLEPGDLIACKPFGSLGANHLAIARAPDLITHCHLQVGVSTWPVQHLRVVSRYRLLDNFDQ